MYALIAMSKCTSRGRCTGRITFQKGLNEKIGLKWGCVMLAFVNHQLLQGTHSDLSVCSCEWARFGYNPHSINDDRENDIALDRPRTSLPTAICTCPCRSLWLSRPLSVARLVHVVFRPSRRRHISSKKTCKSSPNFSTHVKAPQASATHIPRIPRVVTIINVDLSRDSKSSMEDDRRHAEPIRNHAQHASHKHMAFRTIGNISFHSCRWYVIVLDRVSWSSILSQTIHALPRCELVFRTRKCSHGGRLLRRPRDGGRVCSGAFSRIRTPAIRLVVGCLDLWSCDQGCIARVLATLNERA